MALRPATLEMCETRATLSALALGLLLAPIAANAHPNGPTVLPSPDSVKADGFLLICMGETRAGSRASQPLR